MFVQYIQTGTAILVQYIQMVTAMCVQYIQKGNSNVSSVHANGNSLYLLNFINCCLCSKYAMQQVQITTDVVSSNLDQGEVYNIMKYIHKNVVHADFKI
jgi:hypothetical protein